MDNWRLWCSLCARRPSDPDQFAHLTPEAQFVLQNCLSLRAMPFLKRRICSECDSFVKVLSQFAQTCTRTQEMLIDLQKRKLQSQEDLNAIREEYDVNEAAVLISYDELETAEYRLQSEDRDEPVVVNAVEFEPVQVTTKTEEEEEDVMVEEEVQGQEENEEEEVEEEGEEEEEVVHVDDGETSDYVETVEDSMAESESFEMDVRFDQMDSNHMDDEEWSAYDLIVEDGADEDETAAEVSISPAYLKVKDSKELVSAPKETNQFKCALCAITFSAQYTLTRHMRVMHKLFECETCGVRCDDTTKLNQHRRLHVRKTCEECGKVFQSKTAYKYHLTSHKDDFPFPCDKCPKRFKNQSRLKRHSDVHSNTVYICTECGVRLNTKVTLKNHMIVHSEEKRYQCPYCDAKFKRNKQLKPHLLAHVGFKKFECQLCDKKFADVVQFRNHKKKMHSELGSLSLALSERIATPPVEQLKKELAAARRLKVGHTAMRKQPSRERIKREQVDNFTISLGDEQPQEED